jgi:uncharacterized protein
MAGAGATTTQRCLPALATTYDGDDPRLLDRVAPLVDFLEITPDAIATPDSQSAHLRAAVLNEYAAVSSNVDFIAHGVGLSIGSFDRWEESYLHLLDELFSHLPLAWHSEHLACTTVAGENVGTMFALPRTEEALDLVCERVRVLQERYRIPFMLEHVIQLLPEAPSEFTPAGFLNAITSRTGCGLLVDAYNLECDAHNQGLAIQSFLDELDFAPVRELHLAGGTSYNGFRLDIHSGLIDASTLALGTEIMRRAPNLRAVTFELLKEAIPLLGHDSICAELLRLRSALRGTIQ